MSGLLQKNTIVLWYFEQMFCPHPLSLSLSVALNCTASASSALRVSLFAYACVCPNSYSCALRVCFVCARSLAFVRIRFLYCLLFASFCCHNARDFHWERTHQNSIVRSSGKKKSDNIELNKNSSK